MSHNIAIVNNNVQAASNVVAIVETAELVRIAHVTTFFFDTLADAAKVFVLTPKFCRAKLDVAMNALRIESNVAQALRHELRTLGITHHTEDATMPFEAAWN